LWPPLQKLELQGNRHWYITLFGGRNGRGNGEEAGGSGAFQIFGNVLLPMMLMSRMMGFDFKGMMNESLGELALVDGDQIN
jgi:hypothetical protein